MYHKNLCIGVPLSKAWEINNSWKYSETSYPDSLYTEILSIPNMVCDPKST